ncbi:hypothetical protein [Marinomonas sp. 2405UD68-3]|uniref:hypothetical protein n=1 Tax=Marinomonas sp. 2405UD68-3 TaxID=3391835 RepID=UPI0039C9D119
MSTNNEPSQAAIMLINDVLSNYMTEFEINPAILSGNEMLQEDLSKDLKDLLDLIQELSQEERLAILQSSEFQRLSHMLDKDEFKKILREDLDKEYGTFESIDLIVTLAKFSMEHFLARKQEDRTNIEVESLGAVSGVEVESQEEVSTNVETMSVDDSNLDDLFRSSSLQADEAIIEKSKTESFSLRQESTASDIDTYALDMINKRVESHETNAVESEPNSSIGTSDNPFTINFDDVPSVEKFSEKLLGEEPLENVKKPVLYTAEVEGETNETSRTTPISPTTLNPVTQPLADATNQEPVKTQGQQPFVTQPTYKQAQENVNTTPSNEGNTSNVEVPSKPGFLNQLMSKIYTSTNANRIRSEDTTRENIARELGGVGLDKEHAKALENIKSISSVEKVDIDPDYDMNYEKERLFESKDHSMFNRSIQINQKKSIAFDYDSDKFEAQSLKAITRVVKSVDDAIDFSEALQVECFTLERYLDEYEDIVNSDNPNLRFVELISDSTSQAKRRVESIQFLQEHLKNRVLLEDDIDRTDTLKMDKFAESVKAGGEQAAMLGKRITTFAEKIGTLYKDVVRKIMQKFSQEDTQKAVVKQKA